MKLVAYILAAILLVMSCLPCADNAVNRDTAKEHVAHTHEKGKEHDHKDFCSPLCVCACCSITTVQDQHVSISFPKLEIHHVFYAYYLGAVNSVSIPVWQPPQLAA